MEERTGEAFEFDARLPVVGRKLQPVDVAPAFALDHVDPADGSMQTVSLADSAGLVRLLNVINSLDTPVCHIETRRWEDLRRHMPGDVQFFTVSMDLPYAQSRWQSAEHVKHPALSA